MTARSVTMCEVLARLEVVLGATIRALGVAMLAHIKENAGVVVPNLHAGLFGWAKDAALGV